MTPAFKLYRDAWCAGFRPEPLLSVSDWSDRHRRLSSRASAEPGRWCTSRTPYLREIMDCLSPSSPIERVVVMKGAQVGLTEMGLNWLGYIIAHAPGPAMMVLPTTETAKRVSKQRISALVQETPELRALVRDPRSRDSGNTVLMKEFPGGVLILAGANSAVGLRSMPVRYLFLDEVDGFPPDADGEGDPVELAERRTDTFTRRKILMDSTPTLTGLSRIETAYLESDQRRFWVPCPECEAMQVLEWERMTWPPGEPHQVVYRCAHCPAEIRNHHKTWMLERGAWRAGAVTAGDGRTAGFHLSSLYSPVGWFSWEKAAAQWEKAKGNPERVQTFCNTALGLTYADEREAPDWERLAANAEDYRPGTVPMGGLVLVAGADVQRDRIEVEIVVFGRNGETWSVDYRVFHGDPFQGVVWRDLDELLKERFPHAAGGALTIERLAIDAGDGVTTHEVYQWARRYPIRRVLCIKGSARAAVALGPANPVDVNVNGQKLSHGVKVSIVGVNILKARLYARLRLAPPAEGAPAPEGYCHFPRYDEEFFKMLTAEQVVKRANRQGFAVVEWVKTRPRNEALDCRVYATAAALAVGVDRFTDYRWAERERLAGLPAAPAPVAEITESPPAARPAAQPVSPAAPSTTTTQRPSPVIRSRWLSGG